MPVIQTSWVRVLQTYFLADPCILVTFSFPVDECFVC